MCPYLSPHGEPNIVCVIPSMTKFNYSGFDFCVHEFGFLKWTLTKNVSPSFV